MRVKTISRDPELYERSKPTESNRVFRYATGGFPTSFRLRALTRLLAATLIPRCIRLSGRASTGEWHGR